MKSIHALWPCSESAFRGVVIGWTFSSGFRPGYPARSATHIYPLTPEPGVIPRPSDQAVSLLPRVWRSWLSSHWRR